MWRKSSSGAVCAAIPGAMGLVVGHCCGWARGGAQISDARDAPLHRGIALELKEIPCLFILMGHVSACNVADADCAIPQDAEGCTKVPLTLGIVNLAQVTLSKVKHQKEDDRSQVLRIDCLLAVIPEAGQRGPSGARHMR